MGMGTAPCHAWTISLDVLKKICPTEVDACETVFNALGIDWAAFALGMTNDDHTAENMVTAWEGLQDAFKEKTEVGTSNLELGIGHYSRDDGDRYDDLEDGCYFTVDNVTQFSPAGEKFREQLENKSWTVFG